MLEVTSKEEAKKYITEDIRTTIYECITTALSDYDKDYKNLKYKHSTRTGANIVHDLIEHNIKKSFQDKADIRFGVNKNCFKLLIGKDDAESRLYILRFKKLNKLKIASSNFPQQKATGFEQFSVFSNYTNLNAGYLLDGLDARIFITCPLDNKVNNWELALTASEQVEIIHMPQSETQLLSRKPKPKEKRLEKDAAQK